MVTAVEGGIRPPAVTNAPASTSAVLKAPTSAMTCSSSAGSMLAMVGSTAESCGRLKKYWLMMVVLRCRWASLAAARQPVHERSDPDTTP
jgi:hypothetical protein